MAKNIDIPDGWEVKKLGEVGKIIGGGTPDTKIDKYWSNNTEKNSIIWLTPTEITNKYYFNYHKSNYWGNKYC